MPGVCASVSAAADQLACLSSDTRPAALHFPFGEAAFHIDDIGHAHIFQGFVARAERIPEAQNRISLRSVLKTYL